MSVVLGVDPSLTVSGCALVRFGRGEDAAEPLWEIWRGRSSKPEVESAETSYRRMAKMLTEILALVPRRLDLSVVEGPSMGSASGGKNKKFSGLADERAGLRWLLISQLYARGPVVLVTPKGRAKLATGNGNADKAAVKAAMRLALPSVRIPDDNVADAAALAMAGAHTVGLDVGYTPKQMDAHRAIEWPELGR